MRSRNWGRQKSIRRAVRFLAHGYWPNRELGKSEKHGACPTVSRPVAAPELGQKEKGTSPCTLSGQAQRRSWADRKAYSRLYGFSPSRSALAAKCCMCNTRPEPSPALRIQRSRFPSLRRAAGRSHCATCGRWGGGWLCWLPGLKLRHGVARFLPPWLACPACLSPPPEAGPGPGMASPNPAGRRGKEQALHTTAVSNKLSSDSQPQPCRQEGGRTC
jgi:hypothetical protein